MKIERAFEPQGKAESEQDEQRPDDDGEVADRPRRGGLRVEPRGQQRSDPEDEQALDREQRGRKHHHTDPRYRDAGGVRVSGLAPQRVDPHRRHSAIPDRRFHYDAGAGIFDQPSVAFSDGACHRTRGRRRDHRGGECAPSHQ